MTTGRKPTKITRKIFSQVIKTVPYSSAVTILTYVAFAVIPGASTFITSSLFDQVYRYAQLPSETDKSIVMGLGLAFAMLYVLKTTLNALSSVCINTGIYEKVSHYFNRFLAEKASKLEMMEFEKAETLDEIRRAQDCVSREIIPQIFMMTLGIASSMASVIGIALILAGFSIWFIPISMLSVLPFFIARIIRGK
ncbi:hypothetical protein [Gorillibacterium sp. sgz500922]|uniref:hypothetical protein n=1 Tax=Gorillibacterium sp. sgz500922 TaxID=3446694 RepID=UPI003F66C916